MSKNSNSKDPYVYPNSSVLINKFGLKNHKALQEIEGFIYGLKNFEPLPSGNFDYDHLKAIHYHFFGDVYEWAGKERTVDIAKGDCYFGHKQYITKELNKLFSKLKTDNYLCDLPHNVFFEKLSFYFNEINAAHPFREGNGRTQRAFCEAIAKNAGYNLDWTKANKNEYIQASINGFLHGDYKAMERILKSITVKLTQHHNIDKITINKIDIGLLKNYVNKQLELTENIRQKYILTEQKESKKLSQKILMLNNDLKQIAKTIADDPSFSNLLKESKLIMLQKQNNLERIDERLQNSSFTNSDILTILRHAKNTVSLSQSLNQKNSRSK